MTPDTETIDRLANTSTIDITTTGRRSGRRSRIEIWWWRFEDRFVITGTPGPRDWYANLVADCRLTVHALGLDVAATAIPISEKEFRRRFFQARDIAWYANNADLERLVNDSPMVEVHFLR